MIAEAGGIVNHAEYIVMGGGISYLQEEGLASVARITMTDNNKAWTYDQEMPYERVHGDPIIFPNGKICLFNGWRWGVTGGGIGQPINYGTANDVFCYDFEKPMGDRWSVMASSYIRRHYHSTAVLMPNGKASITGTDQATYDPATSYNHRGEVWTPPWILNGVPRPVIDR